MKQPAEQNLPIDSEKARILSPVLLVMPQRNWTDSAHLMAHARLW
jgi:hypothetical protein